LTSLEGFERPTVKVEESLDKQMTKISIIETISQNSKLSIRPELSARKTQRKLLSTINTYTWRLKGKEEARE